MNKPSGTFINEIASIARIHILLVAMIATLVFGWLFGGEYLWFGAVICGLDWFLINLLNRITDIAEDLRNGIVGTERVARQKKTFTTFAFTLLVLSFGVNLVWFPALLPWRAAVQIIGLAYSYRLVWTPRGRRRLKELYFAKNFGSSVLFVLTCFVYPLVLLGFEPDVSPYYIVVMAIFFVLFELTYEILYDVRDLDGDRAAGVPTYPVVHGIPTTRRIIDALLIGSGAALAFGFVAQIIGVREMLMCVAPITQWLFYRSRWKKGLIPKDCIVLTHLGSAQLVLFLVGTAVWQWVGLPENIYLNMQ